ncbi:MAG TPA: FixH family protein [Gammaproteobacteria bacterium]
MTTDAGTISQSSKRAFRNPWVLGWIALVVIVLGVNIAMISLAVTTNPGLVDKDYYEKGRDFENNVQKQIAAHNALGWSGRLDTSGQPRRGQTTPMRFSVVDNKGLPISNLKMTLVSYRPSDVSADFNVDMKEFAPGLYQADVSYPLKGLWEVTVRVDHNEQRLELAKQRINVAE